MSFDDWKNEVDEILLATFGVTSDDLPDRCFMDAFEEGVEPEDFVNFEYQDEMDYLE